MSSHQSVECTEEFDNTIISIRQTGRKMELFSYVINHLAQTRSNYGAWLPAGPPGPSKKGRLLVERTSWRIRRVLLIYGLKYDHRCV